MNCRVSMTLAVLKFAVLSVCLVCLCSWWWHWFRLIWDDIYLSTTIRIHLFVRLSSNRLDIDASMFDLMRIHTHTNHRTQRKCLDFILSSMWVSGGGVWLSQLMRLLFVRKISKLQMCHSSLFSVPFFLNRISRMRIYDWFAERKRVIRNIWKPKMKLRNKR